MVMVNASMAYAQMGEKDQAEKSLVQAIKIAPDNAAAHFNLGLLKAEQNRGKEAERELKEAFRLDPKMAPAAYNLCILTGKDRPAEALSWCRKAVQLHPQEPKYAYTLAFYQKEQGDLKGAAATLQKSPQPNGPALRTAICCWPRFTCSRETPPGRGGAPPGANSGESLAPGPGPAGCGAAEIEPALSLKGKKAPHSVRQEVCAQAAAPLCLIRDTVEICSNRPAQSSPQLF